ncbi:MULTISPECIES: sulfite exporter TauE/SafE family protein [Cryobacterium]|uniref:Probable membrane transporter protein n=1 Tax=Cryobacterium glucosi TaxID=1259175 RepID=A0ABY2IU35_9MICO|nr:MULTISPECIES: sulfite exporter TauE/SafE family protein [Cryobacterium]MDY7528022.1 sulfite exporter TauE/SafE family protein [Cryobacterium sp. 10C2]MDY7556222.1 sulfite exporter TauE/SafE family protein [Cryobacterium sp. 10C3]MEB0003492.1 sulfite exporter TauE/SafE family protein [Cryobacterium sp. RTC2.1]MEB0203401.1 sulfite exporter TauE/SafE family protein [Cryobacterium sp. 5I3]MEB0287957.1 sulfite exporter TauE/SafE family protein [Cryobacterium sp. 10S3]
MWPEAFAIAAAGFAAGMINVVVGSGTLITFPILVLLGYPPLVANVSNNLGLVAGGVAGTIGYRREIAAHRGFAFALLPVALAGGLAGATLLLVLPSSAFKAIVPVLILVGILLVAVGPWIQRRIAARTAPASEADAVAAPTAEAAGIPGGRGRRVGIMVSIFILGVYGGYFGAAQGILVVGALGILTTVSLGSLNAVKNLLVTGVNLMASIIFILFARDSIDWAVVGLITVGAGLGGLLGARVGRRLPPTLLRVIIVTVGVVALVNLMLHS